MANAVAAVVEAGETYVVIGGDCTNGVGAIAGAGRDKTLRAGVIYLDTHGDLNTPKTVVSGALDWMGMEGTVPAFANLDGRSPILKKDPLTVAKSAVDLLDAVDRIVVHFDVDVIDFAKCALGENYRHGEGCTLALATQALPAFTGVTVAQLNPDHGEEGLATLKQFSKALAGALAP